MQSHCKFFQRTKSQIGDPTIQPNPIQHIQEGLTESKYLWDLYKKIFIEKWQIRIRTLYLARKIMSIN